MSPKRIHEFPLADQLFELIAESETDSAPLFPKLYSKNEKQLNGRLAMPRKHMQSMLRLNDRPKATLHSFRATFNNSLRDLGLNMDDRQILLAHASCETTKIYTHRNFDLAAQFVNLLPKYGKDVK